MRKNSGITLIMLIIYIILTLLVLGMLSVLGMNFRKNLNSTNEQTIRDIEFDKLNLQLLKETKTEGNVINESESNSTKIVFSNGNVYTYNEAEQTVYLNENIKIAEHIEACTFKIKSVETDAFNETRSYTDKNGDVAVIPAGFMVSGVEDEQTIDTGLVIYEAVPTKKQRLNAIVKVNDMQRVTEYVLISEASAINWNDGAEVATAQTTYDQFVWIPISHTQINNMYICQAKTGSNGNCNIEVVNGEAKCTVHNSTQMAGRIYATAIGETFEQGYTEVYTPNTGLREPDVVTNSTDADGNSENLTQLSSILGTTGYDTTENFKQSLQEEYNEVVKSVYENQGFYIGRYETSNMLNENTNTTVKSVAGTTTGISTVTWYRMYAQQKKYAENKGLTSVKSTMIQGSAYDQVMKFVENGKRPDGSTYTIKTVGNVGHDLSGRYQTGGLNYSSSTQYNDKVKNIYDLEGNVRVWTTEANFTYYRVFRGRLLLRQRFSKFPLPQHSEPPRQQLWFLCPALRRSEC